MEPILSNAMRRRIGRPGSRKRADMPPHVFLSPVEQKYPVRIVRNGEWVLSKALLVAAVHIARLQEEPSIEIMAQNLLLTHFNVQAVEIEKQIMTMATDLSIAGKANPVQNPQRGDGQSVDPEEAAFGMLDIVEPKALFDQLEARKKTIYSGVIVPITGPLFSNSILGPTPIYAIVDDVNAPNIVYGTVRLLSTLIVYGNVQDLLDAHPEDQIFMPEVKRIKEPGAEVKIVLLELEQRFEPPVPVTVDIQMGDELPDGEVALDKEESRLIDLVKERGSFPIVRANAPEQIITILLAEPGYVDAHDDHARREVVAKMSQRWLSRFIRNAGQVGVNLRHGEDVAKEVELVGNDVTRVDEEFEDPIYGKQKLKAGSWIASLRLSDRLWRKAERKEIDGGSFEGKGTAKIFDPAFLIPADAK